MLQEKIKNVLIEKFDPDAIIIHGSRARGFEREHSDWDFFLLYNEETPHKSGRISVDGQNIEYTTATLPIADMWDTFGAKLSHAQVVYEKDSVGSALLTQAEKFYNDGVHWSDAKKEAHKLWFEGRIEGMRHYTDQPEMFYKYFSDLYSRLTNYWYWIKQHKHSEPIYVAIPEIADNDPKYADLLKQLADPKTTLEQKVAAAEAMSHHLFT